MSISQNEQCDPQGSNLDEQNDGERSALGTLRHIHQNTLDLSALEALEKAATPGPWEALLGDVCAINADWPDGPHWRLFRSPAAKWVEREHIYCREAEFVAALRNAAPELIRRARRLEQLEKDGRVNMGLASFAELVRRAERLERIEQAAREVVASVDARRDGRVTNVGAAVEGLRAALEDRP